MITGRDLLRFCAYCPNPCRRAVPAERALQVETETPSAMSLIALAVVDGQLPFDADARRVLARTEVTRQCRVACPYDYDIAGAIEAVVKEREASNGQAH